MIWLHFFGHEGMTHPMQRETLHTCTGLCKLACDRVTKAFNYIRNEWIYWPDVEERKVIAKRIETEFIALEVRRGSSPDHRTLHRDLADPRDPRQLHAYGQADEAG